MILVINLTSSSKRDLARACRHTSRSLERFYRFSRSIGKTGLHRPVRLKSFGFRSPNRWSSMRKRLSVIRSPFVYKKSGETFLFSRHRARMGLAVNSPTDDLGHIRLALRLGNSAVAFHNVEMRLSVFHTINEH